jgi:Tfp pilus assembly protein PilZ
MNMFRTLSVAFERQDEFEREFRRNIARGGIFVPTLEEFELREVVEIEIDLRFCAEKLCLQGEVVSRIRPGFESEDTEAGVAVQLLDPAEQIRDQLHELTGVTAPDAMPDTWPGRPGPARRHERAPTQLPAEVEWKPGALDTEATNLSSSGILIAVEDEPIPIGEQVRVKFAHPRTGETIALAGTVVRHEEQDGRVAAVGIEFFDDAEVTPIAAEIAADLRAAAHARQLGGISGSISALGVPNLLQMFSSSSTEGTLTVTRDDQHARVLFEQDMLRQVELGNVTGRKALSRLLAWQEGVFEFQPLILPGEPGGALGPMHAAVLEALQYVDELAGLDTSGFPPGVTVRTTGSKPKAKDLNELEKAVYLLVLRNATVQQILDGIEAHDSDVFGALLRLQELGFIRI